MISWLHNSGISGWWKHSAYLSAFLPGERIPRCALARSNLIYTCTSFTCLHTGDSNTPLLLSAQRVGPLRFVGINKQFHFRNVSKSVFRRGIELVLIDQVNARASEKIQLHPLSWYDTCLSQSHLNRFRTPRFEGQTTMWKLVCEHYLCVATHGFCHKAHKIGVASRSQRPLRCWTHYRTPNSTWNHLRSIAHVWEGNYLGLVWDHFCSGTTDSRLGGGGEAYSFVD